MSSPITSAAESAAQGSSKARFADYLALTKPRLSFLSVMTAMIGYLAARPAWDAPRFFFTLLGTSLAAGGVAALNQWLESDTDARMKRTADRPIPSGKVATGSAFVLGWLLCAAGLAFLFYQANGLAASFALATIVSYLAVYTPAKRWSRWSTELGAIAGAFPPLIGWAAAGHQEPALGWILFGVLLFWQIPHFMAIAWIYRNDYENVSFPMLPVRDASGVHVARWSLINTFALVMVTALPSFLGLASTVYLGITIMLGLWFIARAIAFMKAESREVSAKKLFYASIIWLPLQLTLLVVDRWFFAS